MPRCDQRKRVSVFHILERVAPLSNFSGGAVNQRKPGYFRNFVVIQAEFPTHKQKKGQKSWQEFFTKSEIAKSNYQKAIYVN